MTRLELLKIVIGRAHANGFEFRRWYTNRLGLPWISVPAALELLHAQRRYYALLFSHEFAMAFWKAGEDITFQVPAQSFQRHNAKGEIVTITRKPYTRRSGRRDAWRYHLREMALADEPLRYIRKYLNVEEALTEDLDEILEKDPAASPKKKPAKAAGARPKKRPRPLPAELPAFLRRPYPPPEN